MESTLIRPVPTILVKDRWLDERTAAIIRAFTPRSDFGAYVKSLVDYLPPEQAAELIERVSRIVIMESQLELTAYVYNHRTGLRETHDYGVVSRKVVTDAFVAALVDVMDGAIGFANIANFKYHGLGTGTNAEAAADTALQTELTTEYTGNVRATGNQSQPTAPQYRTLGTNTLDSGTPAITEHGVFSASTSVTLLDRSKFSAINLDGTAGDSLASTYTVSFTSGG